MTEEEDARNAELNAITLECSHEVVWEKPYGVHCIKCGGRFCLLQRPRLARPRPFHYEDEDD